MTGRGRREVHLGRAALALAACALVACTPSPKPSDHASPTGEPAVAVSTTTSTTTSTPSASPALGVDASAYVQAVFEHQRRLQDHLDGARVKMNARDGSGCLAELDAYDKIDPPVGKESSDPQSSLATMRGLCMMLAGECSAGKTLYRAALVNSGGATMGPEMIDRSLDAMAGLYCEGAGLTPRDKIARASMGLMRGAYQETKDVAFCNGHIKTLEDLIPTTPPRDANDSEVIQAPDALNNSGVACLARAGDCAAAFTLYEDLVKRPDLYKYQDARRREMIARRSTQSPEMTRTSFEAIHQACRGK